MEPIQQKYMVVVGGGGAGAGIGGNGGKGGNANTTQISRYGIDQLIPKGQDAGNPQYNTNAGWNGEDGEDCGNIYIYDTLKVYAYGGAGGSAGNGIISSGGGGGGYPAAGIGGGGAGGGGGNHFAGAGGYSGGGAENNTDPGYNGFGGGIDDSIVNFAGGSGYLTLGYSSENKTKSYVGGVQGAFLISPYWFPDVSGFGGNAGAGGNVFYTNASNIFAYNGDAITNGDYTTPYYEYMWSLSEGTYVSTTKMQVATKIIVNSDGTTTSQQFIPCKIFAQSGVIRETYTTNQSDILLAKIESGLTKPARATKETEVVMIKATNAVTNNATTGYNNGYMLNQGIGSGAGYLEASNGTFSLISRITLKIKKMLDILKKVS